MSASDFVRNFGHWQHFADREAVYVLHHGRPRYVLTSVDLMRDLTERGANDTQADQMRDTLLDAMEGIALVVDSGGGIVATSRVARTWLNRPDWRSLKTDALFPPSIAPMITTTIARVAASGIQESLMVGTGPRGPARLDLHFLPLGAHVAIIITDLEDRDSNRLRGAYMSATREALEQIERVAVVRLNLRGFVRDPSAVLSGLTRLSPESIASVRFGNLLTVDSRAAFTTAFDATIEERTPRRLDAKLMVNGGDPIPIRIGMSAQTLDAAIDSIVVGCGLLQGP